MEIVLSLLSAYGPEQSPCSSRISGIWLSFSLLPSHSVPCLAWTISWCSCWSFILLGNSLQGSLFIRGVCSVYTRQKQVCPRVLPFPLHSYSELWGNGRTLQ